MLDFSLRSAQLVCFTELLALVCILLAAFMLTRGRGWLGYVTRTLITLLATTAMSLNTAVSINAAMVFYPTAKSLYTNLVPAKNGNNINYINSAKTAAAASDKPIPSINTLSSDPAVTKLPAITQPPSTEANTITATAPESYRSKSKAETQMAFPVRQIYPPIPPKQKTQSNKNWENTSYRISFSPAKGETVTWGKLLDGTAPGPAGISTTIRVFAPADFDPNRGDYNVIVVLHGYPGTIDAVHRLLDLPRIMQLAHAQNNHSTIFVMPEFNIDKDEPDCVDFTGRPLVGTWIWQTVPRIIMASFPSAARSPNQWAIMGVSSGAYCAIHTGLMHPETYGQAIGLSGYDYPLLGGLKKLSPQQRSANRLSVMLGQQRDYPARLFLGYTVDDADSRTLVKNISLANRNAQDEIIAYKQDGGHNWQTWKKAMPAILAFINGAKSTSRADTSSVAEAESSLRAPQPKPALLGPLSPISGVLLTIILILLLAITVIFAPHMKIATLSSHRGKNRKRNQGRNRADWTVTKVSKSLAWFTARVTLIVTIGFIAQITVLVFINLDAAFFVTWGSLLTIFTYGLATL